MASFGIVFSTCLLSLQLLSSAAERPDLASEVCKNTTDFAFCHAAIYSDPRAPTADRYSLIDIVFRKAYLNASDTGDYIASKIKSGAGKTSGLKRCQADYKKAIQTLGEMLNNLNSESYYELDLMSIRIERNVRACTEALHRQSIIKKRNQNMLKLANICYVVSKLFEYR